MTNIVNGTPYLRSTRSFPENLHDLAFQSSKAYLEVANAVNQRTIGIYPVIKSAITGDQWFVNKNRKQQSLRQVYTFGANAAGTTITIPYKIPGFDQFVRIWGTCITTNTAVPGPGPFVVLDYRPIPYSSVTAVNQQIELKVTPTNIIVNIGAASPNLISGLIIIEWLSLAWYSQDI